MDNCYFYILLTFLLVTILILVIVIISFYFIKDQLKYRLKQKGCIIILIIKIGE